MYVSRTVFVTLVFHMDLVVSRFLIPDLSRKTAILAGDLNIGILMPMSARSQSPACSDKLKDMQSFITTVSIHAEVTSLNQELVLPGDLKLGYVILDDCERAIAATVQSLAFTANASCPAPPNPSPTATKEYDVVAVIGLSNSYSTGFVASVLCASEVPFFGVRATSDALYEKSRYPYLVRVMPPDTVQFQAVQRAIRLFNWTCVTAVHQTEGIGRRALEVLYSVFDTDDSVCLRSVHSINHSLTEAQAHSVVKELKTNKTRAILLTASPHLVRIIIRHADEQGLLRTHVFIIIELWEEWMYKEDDLDERFNGILFVRPTVMPVDYELFQKLNDTAIREKLNTVNDWYKEAHANYLSKHSVEYFYGYVSIYDSYVRHVIRYLVAASLRRILNKCSSLTGAAARRCVTGPRMLDEITELIQESSNTDNEMRNIYEDIVGYFMLAQACKYTNTSSVKLGEVARFYNPKYTLNSTHYDGNISWKHLTEVEGTPTSFCSDPCKPGTAQVAVDKCAWKCVQCEANARPSTCGCIRCPPFYWPDQRTGNATCAKIEPVHSHWATKIWIVYILTAVIGLVLCLVAAISYCHFRSNKIIYDSPLARSFVALLGIALGFVDLLTEVFTHSDVSCRLSNLLVSLSFTALYGSLFVRCVCIYRIFDAFLKQAPLPRFTDGCHQTIGALGLVIIQAAITVMVNVYFKEDAWNGLQQSSPMKKHVEMTCTTPTAGCVTLILPSLLLLLLCTGLSFPIRYLSNNFMEAGFIFKFCCASLVAWLCCIPTYFLFIKISMVKITIWALLIGLNHLAALAFVFATRIYGALYMGGDATLSVTSSVAFVKDN